MGKRELTEQLVKLGFIEENYNTNNEWGFGGAIGTKLIKDNIIVNIGTAYFRHRTNIKFIKVIHNGNTVCDYIAYSEYYTRAFAKIKELLEQ